MSAFLDRFKGKSDQAQFVETNAGDWETYMAQNKNKWFRKASFIKNASIVSSAALMAAAVTLGGASVFLTGFLALPALAGLAGCYRAATWPEGEDQKGQFSRVRKLFNRWSYGEDDLKGGVKPLAAVGKYMLQLGYGDHVPKAPAPPTV